MSDRPPRPLSVAVVIGGHAFDVVAFHRMLRALSGVDAYVQSLDDWCVATPAARAAYDVVLFFTMHLPTPVDDGLPWFAGRQRAALSELGTTAQGIVVLHHAIAAFPDWRPWSELIGIADRALDYHWNGSVRTDVARPEHPITRGLPSSWSLDDETYTMREPAGPDVEVLLTTAHAPSMRSIAWTNRFGRSRVFCYQSGHGPEAHADVHFRTVLTRGIQWVSGR